MKFIRGGILDNGNKSRILRTRQVLTKIKDFKYLVRQEKYKNQIASELDMLDHLRLEYREFLVSHTFESKASQLKEIADMQNCLDILAMMVIFE